MINIRNESNIWVGATGDFVHLQFWGMHGPCMYMYVYVYFYELMRSEFYFSCFVKMLFASTGHHRWHDLGRNWQKQSLLWQQGIYSVQQHLGSGKKKRAPRVSWWFFTFCDKRIANTLFLSSSCQFWVDLINNWKGWVIKRRQATPVRQFCGFLVWQWKMQSWNSSNSLTHRMAFIWTETQTIW